MTLLPVLLPKGYIAKVAVGQKITAGKVLAQKSSDAKEEVVHLAKDLGISPKAAVKSLKKALGSSLEKGDVIAVKKGNLGIGKKQVISEFSGILVKIDEENGDLYVRILGEQEVEEEPIISPVDGVVDFCDNKKIVLKAEKTAIVAKKVCGQGAKGPLLIIAKNHVEDEDIKREVDGKIIAGKIFEKAAIFKAFALEALGIITTDSLEQDLEDILAKNLNRPVFLISQEDFGTLEKYSGKEIYLDTENKAIFLL
jgi:hypothetical protein